VTAISADNCARVPPEMTTPEHDSTCRCTRVALQMLAQEALSQGKGPLAQASLDPFAVEKCCFDVRMVSTILRFSGKLHASRVGTGHVLPCKITQEHAARSTRSTQAHAGACRSTQEHKLRKRSTREHGNTGTRDVHGAQEHANTRVPVLLRVPACSC
jgi:hypothetical protein